MATHDTQSERGEPSVGPVTAATIERGRGIIEHYRERAAARRSAWLVSARGRRLIARWLRRTAKVASDQHPIRRRQTVLLHDRAAAVRTELLAIAAMLERADHPDPACMTQLRELLANGCNSPLYNADIHVSELRATLYGVRAGLVRTSASRSRGVAFGHTLRPTLRRSHA